MASVPHCCSNKCRSSRCESCDSEVKVENIGEFECEIFIYTKNLPIFTSARDRFISAADYGNVADSIENLSVPIFEHWILVSKFYGLTLWMDATERNGILHTDILDSEPEDIESRFKIGVVKISIPNMMKLFYDNKLSGEKYSFKGANCQSLIKDILEKLEIRREIRIINDIVDLIFLEELERETVFDYKSNSTNNEREINPEIWIYTRRLQESASLPKNIDKKKRSLIEKARVNVLKHWILVIKFQSVTFWIEANSYNRFLYSRFMEMEPDEVEDRKFIGSVNMTVIEMANLYDKVDNQFRRSKYNLAGANCQSWILGFLKELEMGKDLTIINDVITTGIGAAIGAAVGTGIYVIYRIGRFLILKF